MNCPFCDKSTRVLNSRSRSHRVWRRRGCKSDHVFTTYESLHLPQVAVKKRETASEQLQPTKLLLSLVRCGLNHTEAIELEQTIRGKLYQQLSNADESISTKQIAEATHQVLAAYDPQFADRYRSYSDQL